MTTDWYIIEIDSVSEKKTFLETEGGNQIFKKSVKDAFPYVC